VEGVEGNLVSLEDLLAEVGTSLFQGLDPIVTSGSGPDE